MRIFEVKNNLVKIFYETSDNLFLSGFVMIKDSRESYIGQIMHLESSKHGNVAIAKIIFNITPDGVITTYSGTIPAINSAISNINSADFLKLIQGQNPILLGEFIENDLLVSVDKSILENKLVICSENQENIDLTIKTLNQQIKNYDKKTIIIDTQGESIFDKNTFIMGENFHLPINHQLINFIYEKGLEYKSARSKAILQETFLELQYYLSSLEEPYIPVNKFIDILEKQYNETKLPELVLLKNSLVKFDEYNVFAKNVLDYKNLTESLNNKQTTVINISKVDEMIQREVIFYVYSLIKDISEDFYIFVKLNNGNSDKKLLKQIFSNKTSFTITNCSYSYKYLTELKKIAKDLILFTPLIQQQDFASYNTLLTTLGRNEFVVYGQSTQFMPLIVKLSERTKYTKPKQNQTITQEDVQKIVEKQLKEQQKRFEEEKEKKEAYKQQQELTQQLFQQQASQMVYPQGLPQQPQIFYPQQPPVYPQPQMFAQPMFNQPQYMQPYTQPFIGQVPNFGQPQQFFNQGMQPIVQPQIMQQMPQMMYNQPVQQVVQPQQAFQQSQNFVPPQQMANQMQGIIQPQQQFQQQMPQQQVDQTSLQQNNQYQAIPQPQQASQELNNVDQSNISKENSQQAPSEVTPPIFKSIEPQEMPIEAPITPEKEVKETPVQEDSKHLTEEDLDLIQNVDMYEEQEPEIVEEFPKIQEEDDSYLDNITPDDDVVIDVFEDNNSHEETQNENVEEEDNNNETSQQENSQQTETDIKTQYNITEESLKEEEIIPVYPANTGNKDVNYEKGDLVIHDKFGNGKVEKIINYGSKKLCSIYFEGLGRRLLDPTLSELRKANP